MGVPVTDNFPWFGTTGDFVPMFYQETPEDTRRSWRWSTHRSRNARAHGPGCDLTPTATAVRSGRVLRQRCGDRRLHDRGAGNRRSKFYWGRAWRGRPGGPPERTANHAARITIIAR